MNVNDIIRSLNKDGIFIPPDYNLRHMKKHAETSTKYRKTGNEKYVKKMDDDTCMEILSLYSGSIALAPDNSEELAMGFGNRSALLKHMLKFEESISDIDRALSISKSDSLKAKLITRKDECLKLMKESKILLELVKEDSKKLELPKVTHSKKVPCVVESVSLKYDEKYGKHFVANKDIKPGEIIAIEEAYIAYPCTKKRYTVCSHCLSQTFNGIPCNFCSFIYCSNDCKNQAWQEYHDIECSIIHKVSMARLPSLGFMDFKDKFYFTARFFIKIIKSHSLDKIVQEVEKKDAKKPSDTFFCNQFQSCSSLMSHSSGGNSQNTVLLFEEFSREIINLLFQFKSIFTDKVKSCFESKDEMFAFTKELLMKFFNIESLNAFSFEASQCNCKGGSEIKCDGSCVKRGSIIAPCCSLFNHSCFPNCGRMFAEKKKIVIITTQPIKTGEQLFINYNSQFTSIKISKAARQAFLLKNYSFTCYCPPCSENWPLLDDSKNPDLRVMKHIFADYEKFCRRKGMKPMLSRMKSSPVPALSLDENTLKHLVYMAELLHKNQGRTDLKGDLYGSNYLIGLVFERIYGIDTWNDLLFGRK